MGDFLVRNEDKCECFFQGLTALFYSEKQSGIYWYSLQSYVHLWKEAICLSKSQSICYLEQNLKTNTF